MIPAYVFELCRKFRKESTTAEKLLWKCLRNRHLSELKFRRQHPLGRYIADFYCVEAGLVVELEGKVHNQAEQREYDKIRKEELAGRGLRVMKFDNEEVLKRTERVLAKIVAVAAKRHLTL
ncbi:MAG: endonuclease domain-containing protein [candidate division Zixibacteria bacterium]|nr:endonuclease domain-containing protein [candidate division Zixibacteria bacterium]